MLTNEWCHCVVSAESKWETCSHFLWAFELLHHLSRRKLVFKNCLMSSFCPFCWKNEIMETLLHFLLSLSGAVCGNSVITQPVFDPHSGISDPCTVSHVTIWSYLHWRLGSDAACICICLTVIVWYDSRWKGLHVYCQWHKRGSGLLSPWRQWLHQRLHNLSHHWRSSSDPAQVPHQDPPQGWHASFSYHQHAAGGPWGPHSSAERLHPSGLWHGLQWWLHPL